MFRICKIIAETVESANKLKEYLGGYPVEITHLSTEEDYYDIPTLMIGWNSVKDKFPHQKINNENIVNNLTWSYNEVESKEVIDGEAFYKNMESFMNKNIKAWLPSEYILYDSLMHGDFSKFIKDNIDDDKLTYIHFSNGALYMRNDNNNFIVNAKSLWFTESNYRIEITNILNNLNCMIYSYNEIENYTDLDTLGNIKALDIIRWIKFGVETPIKYFQIIPNVDISKYIPFMMSMVPIDSLELDEEEKLFFNRMCVRDRITRWMSTRYISFSYDFKKNLDFIYRDNAKLAKTNYSNKRTITGRITSNDRYNPQNLSKSGDDRTKIVSRFRGGRIYQFDYTSFESKIALYLTGDGFFIENYYDKDLHSEIATIIHNSIDFNSNQRDVAKLINHAIIYGAGNETIMNKLVGIENPNDKLIKIKNFLHPIINVSDTMREECDEKGYLINKWNSIITPNKSYAIFSNYIQSTAADIVIDKVIEIKHILKNCKSQFMFQVHDSFVFDIHPEERWLISEITKSLSYINGMIFNMDIKSGINYKDLF